MDGKSWLPAAFQARLAPLAEHLQCSQDEPHLRRSPARFHSRLPPLGSAMPTDVTGAVSGSKFGAQPRRRLVVPQNYRPPPPAPRVEAVGASQPASQQTCLGSQTDSLEQLSATLRPILSPSMQTRMGSEAAAALIKAFSTRSEQPQIDIGASERGCHVSRPTLQEAG